MVNSNPIANIPLLFKAVDEDIEKRKKLKKKGPTNKKCKFYIENNNGGYIL